MKRRFVVRHEALAECREKQKRHSTFVSWLTTNKEEEGSDEPKKMCQGNSTNLDNLSRNGSDENER